jgi:flagellar biosynthesis anti-sigma factor FlgM
MRIDAIIQPINAELRKVDSAKKTDKDARTKAPTTDKSDISADAQKLSATNGQFASISASVAAQPDVRTDKVAEVKGKIQSGYYNSDEFIDKLADKLLNEFGITSSS